MGTRGYIVYVIGKKKYYQYNHWDSYPSGLGRIITECLIELLQKYTFEQLKEKMDNLKIVNNNIRPNDDEIEILKKYSDTLVCDGNMNNWYVLLRECQGRIDLTLESGYIFSDDENDFATDTWREFVYTIDFNDDKLCCNDEPIGKITELSQKSKWWEEFNLNDNDDH